MTKRIDTDELRRDMMDNYGTAMYNGFPMAVVDLGNIERASDEELVRRAQREGIDLSEYFEDDEYDEDDEDDDY